MKLAVSLHALQYAGTRLRGWGWPGALGAVCLAIAAGAASWWLPSIHRESAALGAAADDAERSTGRIVRQRQMTEAPISAAQRFGAAFPSALHRQDRLAAMLALAVEHQLEPKRSEFQLSLDRDLGLLRYSVTMPLSGSYEQLRDFIEAAQTDDPALGLDRLRLRRASAGATAIEADLTWSLYMQAGAAASTAR